MNIDYSKLLGMSQADAIAYLNSLYGGQAANLETRLIDDANQQYGDFWQQQLVYNKPMGLDAEGNLIYGKQVRLTDVFDPNYEGGQYGAYYSNINDDGTLGDAYFDKAERHKGWLGENMDWLGPLAVLGPAAFLAAPEIAAATGASKGLTAAQIADLGAISGATNAGAGAAFESALANSAFGAGAGLGGEVVFDPFGSGGDLVNASAEYGGELAGPSATGGGDMFAYGGNDAAAIFGDPSGALSTGAFNTAVAGNSAATIGDILAGGAGSGGVLSGLGSALDAVGGAKGAGALLGGVGGLVSSLTAPDSQTTTQRRTMDPRFDALMFGNEQNPGGLLGRWQQILNRPQSDALKGVYGIANNFFAPR